MRRRRRDRPRRDSSCPGSWQARSPPAQGAGSAQRATARTRDRKSRTCRPCRSTTPGQRSSRAYRPRHRSPGNRDTSHPRSHSARGHSEERRRNRSRSPSVRSAGGLRWIRWSRCRAQAAWESCLRTQGGRHRWRGGRRRAWSPVRGSGPPCPPGTRGRPPDPRGATAGERTERHERT